MPQLNHLAYNVFGDRLDDVPAVTLSACQRLHKIPRLLCGNFTRHRRLVSIHHSLHDGWTRMGERFTEYRFCLFWVLNGITGRATVLGVPGKIDGLQLHSELRRPAK